MSKITRGEFKNVLDKSRAFYSGSLSLNYKKSLDNKDYFSVVVGKTVAKSAVSRNLLKRRAYSILRKHKKSFKNNGYFIVFLKKGAKDEDFNTMQNSLLDVLKKAKIL